MAEQQLSPIDMLPKAVRARPPTLSELEDLLMDCYEAASPQGTEGEAINTGYTVFQIVEAFVFDHVHYKE